MARFLRECNVVQDTPSQASALVSVSRWQEDRHSVICKGHFSSKNAHHRPYLIKDSARCTLEHVLLVDARTQGVCAPVEPRTVSWVRVKP